MNRNHRRFINESKEAVCAQCSGELTRKEINTRLCPCGYKVHTLEKCYDIRFVIGVYPKYYKVKTVVQSVVGIIRIMSFISCNHYKFI